MYTATVGVSPPLLCAQDYIETGASFEHGSSDATMMWCPIQRTATLGLMAVKVWVVLVAVA